MKKIEEFKDAANEVYDKLRLDTLPIGVKFIKDLSEIPEDYKQPRKLKDIPGSCIQPTAAIGQKLSLCQAFTWARKAQTSVAMTAEDNFCVPSSFGFGESCGKGILKSYMTGQPQYVSPGVGDQKLSGTSPHEVALGIPGDLLLYIRKNLFKTGCDEAITYPVPPVMPEQMNESFLPGWEYLREKNNERKGK